MEKEKLESLFKELDGLFDTEEPTLGHQSRFQEKLDQMNKVGSLQAKKNFSWWKPLSIAASMALLFVLGIGYYGSQKTTNENIVEVSPEISNAQFYFTNLVEEQVRHLEKESSPETKEIIDDTMLQLKKLENDYAKLENDLQNGGNAKMILSAMIINFQTRMDLLQDVLDQIETIKYLKNHNDENFTI
ncbi:hypothetical protein ACEZ3G_15735 [Maribacter algicola]|uniref:Uncharacterized protein n=1 Tax=Meishania litoralis TaxID=3434685 RepID=A0ACC7LSE4_9FLAO